MSREENSVTIEFIGNEKNKWRAADLLPKEACVIDKELYIKLGAAEGENNVELRVIDEHRMARGHDGSLLKKHFFFHVRTASIVALTGNTPVTPHKVHIKVLEEVTFLPYKTIPYVVPEHCREIHTLTIDNIGEQEVTNAN